MDPYVYSGTNVLRNLRDIRDAEKLNRFEAIATARRTIELENEPGPGRFDTRHLQAIHCHIFQDVFAWAGEFRIVNISKSGDTFAFHEHIVSSLDKLSNELGRERHLTGADTERFANRGAYYLGELNAIHPFREGNGRAQREFIGQLAAAAGLLIHWTGISQDEMIEASRRSLRIDNTGLQRLIVRALT